MSVPQENLLALEQLVIEGADLLQTLPPPDAGAAIATSTLTDYAGIVERCATASQDAGLPGLQDACVRLSENLMVLDRKEQRDAANERRLLEDWFGLVLNYLGSLATADAEGSAVDLLRYLQDEYWEDPLLEEDVEILCELLLTVDPGDSLPGAAADAPLAGTELEVTEQEDRQSGARDRATDDTTVAAATQTITVDPDTLRLLQGEMSGLMEILMEPAQGAETTADTAVVPQQQALALLERLAASVERLAMAAQAIGFPALYRTYVRVQVNLKCLADTTPPPDLDILVDWAGAATDFLDHPGKMDQSQALAWILTDTRWPDPLPPNETEALVLGLTRIELRSTPALERATQANPDAISLAVPEDIDPELLDGLLQELPQQTIEFSEAVEKLVATGETAEVDTARRIAHTLKGAANVVGIRGLANLTHQLEDILSALAKTGGRPPPPLGRTLVEAADCLAEMNDFLLGLGPQPGRARALLQDVLDWANRIDREGLSTPAVAPQSPRDADTQVRPTHVEDAPTPALGSSSMQPQAVAEAAREPAPEKPPTGHEAPRSQSQPATTPMLRVSAALLDNLLRLSGESVILSGRLQDSVLGSIRLSRSMRAQSQILQRLIQDLEHLVDVRGISLPGLAAGVRDAANFDPLEFEQYNELHTLVHQLQEVATDSRELGQEIDARLAQLEGLLVDRLRLDHEHQEASLLTRMVPVKTLAQRLQRGVRQACRLTDKSVSLALEGTDTLIESNVLGDLIAPLMHILRNAVDHGIEDAKTRRERNKPAAGQIALAFVREGNYILVRCEDDGGGLDYDAIRRIARERGLLNPGSTASEGELNRILMTPGFSTRDEVTQVSGRGIGMDAVHAAILGLRGSIHIQSHAGRGTRVDLRIPVTLLSTQALLVRSGQRTFAISERGVAQVLHASAGRLGRIGDHRTFETAEHVYGLQALDEALGLVPVHDREQDPLRPVILIELEAEGMLAMLVDEVQDSRKLVVKSMGPYVPRLPGIPGATILGDGSIVPVLDLPELLAAPIVATQAAVEEAVAGTQEVMKTALVVDDSSSARRSLAQFASDAGLEVRTAIDGLEAVASIDAAKPDILLVDMEMPRMNGIELTTHLRANPETRDLPIIMITSRSTEKHRRQALSVGVDAYVTKPYVEDRLLAQIGELLGGP